MKAYVVFSSNEPALVVTRQTIRSRETVNGFRRIGCEKFFAREVPVDLVRNLYGHQCDVIEESLGQACGLRVLDYNGRRIFRYLPLEDLGPAYRCELTSPTDAPVLESACTSGLTTPEPTSQMLCG